MVDGATAIAAGFALGLTGLLLWISIADLNSWRIPDRLNGALCALGLISAAWSGALLTGIAGMLIGAGGALLIRFGYFKLRGRQGLGLGDVKFLGAAGAWVGPDGLPAVLLLASLSGLLLVLAQRAAGRETGAASRIAFGPHLALGLLAAWVVKTFELV